MTFARLTAVYGLQPSEIWSGMPLAMIRAYTDRIPRVLAERRVEAATAAGLPYMEDPQEMMAFWYEEAYEDQIEKQAATPGMLKLMGMGVEHV